MEYLLYWFVVVTIFFAAIINGFHDNNYGWGIVWCVFGILFLFYLDPSDFAEEGEEV